LTNIRMRNESLRSRAPQKNVLILLEENPARAKSEIAENIFSAGLCPQRFGQAAGLAPARRQKVSSPQPPLFACSPVEKGAIDNKLWWV